MYSAAVNQLRFGNTTGRTTAREEDKKASENVIKIVTRHKQLSTTQNYHKKQDGKIQQQEMELAQFYQIFRRWQSR